MKNFTKLLCLFLLILKFNFSYGKGDLFSAFLQFENSKSSVIKLDIFQPTFESVYHDTLQKILNNNYTLAEINWSELKDLNKNQYPLIKLTIPYNNELLNIVLFKVDIFTNQFNINNQDHSNYNYRTGVFYRGIIANDSSSLVSLSFFDDEIIGFISNQKFGNLTIGKLKDDFSTGQHIIFNEQNLEREYEFNCHTTENLINNQPIFNPNLKPQLSTKCVSLYYEIDFALYNDLGSNITKVTNWMTAMHNNIATIYNNDGININLSEIFIWTTQDPYNGGNSDSQLTLFKNTRTTFNGDVACLIAKDNRYGGRAYLNQLCTQFNYCYNDVRDIYFSVVPNYSWQINVITHEVGHVLASPHTHECYWNGNNTAIDGCGTSQGYPGCPGELPPSGGTIMSYCQLTSVGVNFNNGFGSQPAELIRNSINNSSCLSPTCEYSCTNPTQFSTETDEIVATITWNETENARSYLFRYRLLGSSSWKDTTVYRNSITLTNLICDTTYQYQVSALCISGFQNAFSSNKIFRTTACVCRSSSYFNPTSIEEKTAFVSWENVNLHFLKFQYRYRSNSIPSTWNYGETTHPFIRLDNLECNSKYEFQVKTICDYGDTSEFINTEFETICPCPRPNPFTTNITYNSFRANWNLIPYAQKYEVSYKKYFSNDDYTLLETDTNFLEINNLECGSNSGYLWFVRSICDTINKKYSEYSEWQVLALGFCCVKPNNLRFEELNDAIIFKWDRGLNNSKHEICIDINGNGYNCIFDIDTNYFLFPTLNNLSCNQEYKWYLRTHCNENYAGISYGEPFQYIYRIPSAPYSLLPKTDTIIRTDSLVFSFKDSIVNSNFLLEIASDSNFINKATYSGFSQLNDRYYKTVKGFNMNNNTYYWRIRDPLSCAPTSITHTFKTSNITATINNELKDFISIFPNPNDGTFNIILDNNINLLQTQLSIVDIEGKVIHKQALTNHHSVITIPDLASGVYFVNIQLLDSKNFQRKLIVIK